MIMIDIDMPDNCNECRFNTEYGFCKAMPDNFCGNTDSRKRPEWCPMKDALALLREQEPITIKQERIDEFYGAVSCCPECDCVWIMGDEGDMHFCPKCGQAVKWND